jgi:hypothetical protein
MLVQTLPVNTLADLETNEWQVEAIRFFPDSL